MLFVDGLRLSEKSFLLINPVLNSALVRDFLLLIKTEKNFLSSLLTQWQK